MNTELINKLVPAELRDGYTFSRQGIITNPGKFEGETIATLYYYDCFLNGGEIVLSVTEEERQAFDIGAGYKAVYLYESDNGFVHLYLYATMEEAQQVAEEVGLAEEVLNEIIDEENS